MRFVTRQTTVRSGVVTTQVSLNGKLIGSITKTRNRPGCVYPYRAFGADGESGFGYLGEFESRKLALAAILEACPS